MKKRCSKNNQNVVLWWQFCIFRKIPVRLIFLYLILFSPVVKAEVVDVSWQNDLVFGTDEGYTNGISFSWASDEIYSSQKNGYVSSVTQYLSDLLFIKEGISDSAPKYFFKIKIGQDMYTPSDLSEEDRIVDEIPYAGHFYVRYTLSQVYNQNVLSYYFSLGNVGPDSKAEETQKSFHRMSGSEEPKGWDKQLRNNTVYGIGGSYTYQVWSHLFNSGDYLDMFAAGEINLGNFIRSGGTGLVIRYGRNVPKVISAHQSPGGITTLASYEYEQIRSSYGWVITYGLFINDVRYFYITDYSHKHDLDRDRVMRSNILSLNFFWPDYEVALALKSVHFSVNDLQENAGWGEIRMSHRF